MDIFADEHMVEMNKKPNTRGIGGRRRNRLRSLSPRVATPPSNQSNIVSGTSSSDGLTLDKSSDNKLPAQNDPLTKEVGSDMSRGKQESSEVTISEEVRLNSHPEPFKSSSLPEEKTPAKTSSLVDKLHQSRKRERTPSPTAFPNSKRLSVSGDAPSSKLTSTIQILRSVSSGGNNHIRSPSPVPGRGVVSSRLSKPDISSASRVLTEEIQKQQGQENAKLKLLIAKEVRKQGKSMSNSYCNICPCSSVQTALINKFMIFRLFCYFPTSGGSTWFSRYQGLFCF